MDDINLDWYTYLTEDFKLDRKMYTVSDRAVFDCPRCGTTDVVRINHVKAKIKKLAKYECSKCRKRDAIGRARSAFADKHGNMNPWQLEDVKIKSKATLMERYGVDNALKLPRFRKKKIPS